MNRYMILAALAILVAIAAGVSSQVLRQSGFNALSVSVTGSGAYQIQVVEVYDEQGVIQPVLQLTK